MTARDGSPSSPTPEPFDPGQYLAEILPAQLQMGTLAPPTEGSSAVLQFFITDVPGCQYWYFAEGPERLEVHAGVNDSPDLTLTLRRSELQALSDNTLDVSAALSSGRLRVHGAPALLRWLAGRLDDSRGLQ